MNTVVQVTPAYPPDISGVGDYADLLAGAFRAAGCPLETLVSWPDRASVAVHNDETSVLGRADSPALVEALGCATGVLLHFSGYGYSKRGLCRWLVDGLAQWKGGGEERRLVTMFHEVYATGPVWRSSYWTAGAQRRIARDLGRLSDAGFVSSRGGFAQISRLTPKLDLRLLPVFSNVGEPNAPAPLSERMGRAVVFGGRPRRKRVYESLMVTRGALSERFENLGISEIVDVGPAIDLPREIGGCALHPLGALPSEEVSAVLSESKIGLIHYPEHVFTKSGIAAAYFAHRLPVINTARCRGSASDLRDGMHFSSLDAFLRGDFDAQKIADAGHEWYRPHGVASAAEIFHGFLA